MGQRRLRSDSLRAVVLGVGGQGLRRAQAIRLANGWSLAGVYDSDQARAVDAARRLGCETWPTEAEAIVRSGADVIVIATPPATHNRQIEAALHAGRHVLCEKPLTVDADSAIFLAREAQRRDLVLATGFNHRFYTPVQKVLECQRSSRLGQICHVEAAIGHPPDEATLDGWLGDRERSGGGVLVDNGSHLVDLIRAIAGELGPVKLEAARWHDRRPGIDTFVKFCGESETGATLRAECSWENPERPYLAMEFVFERGVARISAFPWKSEFVEYGRPGTKHGHLRDRVVAKWLGFRAPGLEPSLVRELDSVRQAIRRPAEENVASEFATAHDGARVAEIVESLRNQADAAYDHRARTIGNAALRSRCA